MTEKDYKLIADILYTADQHLVDIFTLSERRVIVREYVKQAKKFLKLDNSRFDENKFDDYYSGIAK